MRHALFALPLLALAACETPQQSCINDVARELRTVNALIAQTRGNIDRGFALETRQETREVRSTCRGRTESGEAVRVRCEEIRVRDVNVPVTIDLDAERTKLRQLESRRANLQTQTQQSIAQCQALYPEA
ncbi:hypothetical protein SAMN04488515_2430 [Cognatiyoonia koreensis]|uniref:Uncharacterized protein n=2 Tax=Cognatiyoonia koreensis TaxID=364200 RepID=A0A1I0RB96_9RHOB|nr:hypothetical protein SAMN04488515_2430 [Cognatiyoonia koreensis]